MSNNFVDSVLVSFAIVILYNQISDGRIINAIISVLLIVAYGVLTQIKNDQSTTK